MLTEAGGAGGRRAPRAAAAVICALGAERRCLPRQAMSVTIMQSGAGEARAAAAAERAIAFGARGLVSFGVAGGLASNAAPGRLLLPARVVTAQGHSYDADEPWRRRIAAALAGALDADARPLLAAANVLATPEQKRRAAQHGAAAVDLESGAIAAAALAAGVPFVVVRAVADGPSDALPPDVASWIDADGNALVAPLVDAALKPRNWPVLLTLTRRYRAARRTLERAAGRLAPQGFLLE